MSTLGLHKTKSECVKVLNHLLTHNFWSACSLMHFLSTVLSMYVKGCFFLYQEAIETFKEALKLKSDFIDAYKSLGQAYRYKHSAACFLTPCINAGCHFDIGYLAKYQQLLFLFLLPESLVTLNQPWRASRKPSCWIRTTSSLSSSVAWCCTTMALCRRP